MKILLVIEGTYPWYRGGVSEWVYQYLQALDNHTFSVLQIATDEFQGLDPDEALYPLTNNIDEFVRVSPPGMTGEWLHDAQTWYQSLDQSALDLINETDLVHVTNTGFAGWLGVQLSAKADLPLVLTEHAIYWKEINKGAVALECGYKIPDKKLQKEQMIEAFKGMARNVYEASDKIISVSRSNLPFQRELGAEDITYIPNGISKDWLNPEISMKNQPVIGWVGRCAEMKNPHRFLDIAEAFRSLPVNPQFRMLLVDANEKELEKSVKKRAKEIPEAELVWNQDSKGYYADFDFLLITSHNESQPLVMLEALSNMVLPAGWTVGDLTEDYGLVVRKDATVRDLCGLISEVWSQPQLYRQMVEERYEFLKKQHLWPDIFNRYNEIFEQLKQEEVTL